MGGGRASSRRPPPIPECRSARPPTPSLHAWSLGQELGVLSRSVSHKVLALKKRAPVLVGDTRSVARPATPRLCRSERSTSSTAIPEKEDRHRFRSQNSPAGDADPRFQTRRVSSAVLRSGESGISDRRRWRESPVLDYGRHAENRLASFLGGRWGTSSGSCLGRYPTRSSR